MPSDKQQDLKPRSKSSDNVRVIEMRKERSRNAARNRRGKENAQFDELAKLLPLPAAITSQLDKASIIRLTISYLNMREFSGAAPKKIKLQLTDGSEYTPSPSEEISDLPSSPQPSASREVVPHEGASTSSGVPPELLSETGSQLLQALEGFLMVLAIEGKILYVSETVSVNLGLSQVELTGNSVFNYIHQEDHPDILEQLSSGSSVDITDDNQFQDPQEFFPCQGQRGDSIFNQGEEISPPKIFPHQPRSFFVRMKCTLVRRGGSYAKSAGFKVVHCVGRIKEYASDKNEIRRRAFVLLAQPVPTMNINELPLECNMFVSRVNMDLKIVYCEGRIHRFMDYLAKDIVGISAYDFYHAGDVALIQAHHAKFLSKGQVWTKYYRWMNKNGGWVWMQSKASLIPHPSNPALKQMLCLNYILSDVEHRSVVLGMAQLDNKPELTSAPANILTEVPCDGDSSGELNDAFIDDQVMVFPKWQATSDKLVPQQTLLDQMVLQRTGYTQQFNEVFNDWSIEHPLIDRKNSQSDNESHDQDFDEKELQDIADIINADITPFDQSLLDFVVSGSAPSMVDVPSSQLGPIGGYIEEIPTAYVSTTSVVPKIEKSSVVNDYGPSALCTQGRKRPFTESSFSCDGSNTDTNGPNKAPRLSHLEAGKKTASQHQGNKLTMTSTTCPLSAPYTGTSTSTNSSNNHRCAQDSKVDNAQAIDPTRNRVATLATRKPKTLLEQLVMMPGSGKDDDDLLNDDLMLELVEELLDNNADVDMVDNSMSSIPNNTIGDSTSSTSSTLVPLQHIKQEGVSSSSTSSPAKYSECLQKFPNSPMSQQQLGVLHQSTGNGPCQPDSRMQQRNVTMQDDVSTSQNHSSLRPSLQQQLTLPQRLLHSRQKQQSTLPQLFQAANTKELLAQQQLQQQQNSLPQQFQMPRTQQPLSQQQEQKQQIQQQHQSSLPQQFQIPSTKQTFLHQQEQQQKQQIRSSYNGPHQRQPQQQRTPELQSVAEQSQIFRELNELIKRNNNMQQSNQNLNQRVMISSSPLPELSNVIDEELGNLPINNQASSFNTQSFNSNVPGKRNYTGMM